MIALKFEVSCEENNAKRIKLFQICIILLNLIDELTQRAKEKKEASCSARVFF